MTKFNPYITILVQFSNGTNEILRLEAERWPEGITSQNKPQFEKAIADVAKSRELEVMGYTIFSQTTWELFSASGNSSHLDIVMSRYEPVESTIQDGECIYLFDVDRDIVVAYASTMYDNKVKFVVKAETELSAKLIFAKIFGLLEDFPLENVNPDAIVANNSSAFNTIVRFTNGESISIYLLPEDIETYKTMDSAKKVFDAIFNQYANNIGTEVLSVEFVDA